jgi:hypothetical protein
LEVAPPDPRRRRPAAVRRPNDLEGPPTTAHARTPARLLREPRTPRQQHAAPAGIAPAPRPTRRDPAPASPILPLKRCRGRDLDRRSGQEAESPPANRSGASGRAVNSLTKPWPARRIRLRRSRFRRKAALCVTRQTNVGGDDHRSTR